MSLNIQNLSYYISKAKSLNVTGAHRIKASYIPTKKNMSVKDFLPNFGFKEENHSWCYYVNEKVKKPEHIEMIIDNE
tara:strand:+ start:162 stop:392 length:231 start_codon:yes stop_codon:yes gene_type:complete